MADAQITVKISKATKEQVERYLVAHGVKKDSLVEQALLHHLQALRELPAEFVISPQLMLSKESFADVARLVKKPRRLTAAMRALIAGKPTTRDQ